MKHGFLCWLLAMALPAQAQHVQWMLQWQPNQEAEVTGYMVYQLMGTNWTKLGSTPGTNYGPVCAGTWAVSAVAEFGESDRSQSVTSLDDPTNLRAERMPNTLPMKPAK